MNYVDIFFKRANYMGSTVAERAQKYGEHSFDIWLKESPHTVSLSAERGFYFKGIILTNKDDANKKIMFLNVARNVPLHCGDIINWTENGLTEKWIVFRKERKVNESYQVFSIIRCNYLIKWVDINGHVQQSWCYFVSSMDSKVKENFRTWNSLITPQPNKYAEILLPTPEITMNKRTKFMVEDEVWYLIENDFSSVPGITYLSLCEEKINEIYDDLDNDIADTDKIAIYQILLPDQEQTFEIGDEIIPICTITKNGAAVTDNPELDYTCDERNVVRIVDHKLTAIANGIADVKIAVKEHPEVNTMVKIKVGGNAELAAYIEGDASIRLDRTASYKIVSNKSISPVSYSISDNKLASLKINTDNTCVIKANDDNKLGEFVLTASFDGLVLTKTIKIIPIW